MPIAATRARKSSTRSASSSARAARSRATTAAGGRRTPRERRKGAVTQLHPREEPQQDLRSSLGSSPSFPRCHVSSAEPVPRVRPLDDSEHAVDVVHVHVVRHELVDDLRIGVTGSVDTELGVLLDDPRQVALGARDVADLDVVCGQLGGGFGTATRAACPMQRDARHRRRGTISPGTRARGARARVAQQLLDVRQRSRLQDVLEVGVPQPDPLEPDALRVCTAIGEVEQAPLPAEVHLDWARDRPVQAHDVVRESPSPAEPHAGDGGLRSAHAFPDAVNFRTTSTYGTGLTTAESPSARGARPVGFAEPPFSSPQTNVTSVSGSACSASRTASVSSLPSLAL